LKNQQQQGNMAIILMKVMAIWQALKERKKQQL
jgi:hypothetical protein